MKGFSLIELMIVVSIISILSMLALPSYEAYTKRARFSEVLSSVDVYKTAVTLDLQSGIEKALLSTGVEGIPSAPAPTQNLASLRVDQGIITAISTNAAGAASLILKPNDDGTQWSLKGTCITQGLCHE